VFTTLVVAPICTSAKAPFAINIVVASLMESLVAERRNVLTEAMSVPVIFSVFTALFWIAVNFRVGRRKNAGLEAYPAVHLIESATNTAASFPHVVVAAPRRD
jgi:hypothetical protein